MDASPATNNQPSVIGDGFELASGGYIGGNTLHAPTILAATNGHTKTGDLCWRMRTPPSALVAAPAPSSRPAARWRMFSDDGSQVNRVGTLGSASEHWTVTTVDGTVYTFGRNTRSRERSD